jgi:glucosamine-6-phosphate deaminase
MLKLFQSDNLRVKISEDRSQMGACAAADIAACIAALLDKKDKINMIFAAAPSQTDMLNALVKAEGIDWTRVSAFHMDEYIGLQADAPQGFGNFLSRYLFSKLPFGNVYYIGTNISDVETECERYATLLRDHPADIVCMGIGENGHIAFNDPHAANFNDTRIVKVVDLDERCRLQQVNDGCFAALDDVPKRAITLTIPTLIHAEHIFCVVPGELKRDAVTQTVRGEISTACPSTILRRVPHAILYTDEQSGRDLLDETGEEAV